MIPVQFDPSLPAVSVRHAVKTFGVEEKAGRLWQRLTGANGVVQHKKRSIRAVDDVSFEVHRREIFGILGPNGGGKSTLVRLLSTLLIPDSGTITVFGYDVLADERTVKRLLNRVSVDAAFFKKLSPLENLMYAARLYGVDPVAARRQTFEILQRLGIEREAVTEPMEEMSRGMQQKVAIARAFLTQPVLLLLDEPTTGLDPRSKLEVQKFILELRDQHEATILLTTHDMQEAEAVCDRIAIMDSGRIVALDTPLGLKKSVGLVAGKAPTLEEVFLTLTGKHLTEAVALEAELTREAA
ncbi:MAG: ABC transporter ATP-binding protein [Ardenticatenaceae bacterium]|nr:ABC transporter ATP-binding protein [Ardenticatenaceae bacterium]